MGIGGEYAAIDGLLPARVRGWTDLAINGSYRIGTIIGDAATLVLLDPNVIPHSLGWRLCFALGAVLAFAILLVTGSVRGTARDRALPTYTAEPCSGRSTSRSCSRDPYARRSRRTSSRMTDSEATTGTARSAPGIPRS
jgi:hypothetical protein